MPETIKVRREGAMVRVLLNRPAARNAFDADMIKSFAAHMTSLAQDEAVRGLVITGEGAAFSGGGDLKWVSAAPEGPTAAFHRLAGRFHQGILEIRRMSKPVVAAINGVAAGGGFSLALACDFRVMAHSALLRQAYTSSGLCLDGGGSFALPRLVGYARALEIAAFDRPISAQQALTWGLVTKVVEDGHALEDAVNLAQHLAARSLHSCVCSKQ
ncbi:MAG: enoyl-CoA hydratase/isomerase family protein, partial [Terriglobia bacterium]